MRHHTYPGWKRRATVVAVGVLVLSSAGPANADDGDLLGGVNDTVKTLTDTVTKTPDKVAGLSGPSKAQASTPSRAPSAPASSDVSGGNDVADPTPPDHAGAEVLRSQVTETEVAHVGRTDATVRDDDGTSANSDLLALGGTEIPPGAHADSSGTEHDVFDPLDPATAPLCAGSGGQICLSVLFADAHATENGRTSHSASSSRIAGACLGGAQVGESCDAPVQAGLAESNSQATRDQRTGRTTASSSSSLASLCLIAPPLPIPGFPATEGCGLGVTLLSSQGSADSGGAKPSAGRDSSVAGLTIAGKEQKIDQSEALELPPGCTSPSLLCGYVNQGETYLGPGSLAGHAQEALKVNALVVDEIGSAPFLSVIGARSETLVHNDGGEPGITTAPSGDDVDVRGLGANRAPADVRGVAAAGGVDDGLLPNTGGLWSGLLSLGLLALGSGAILMAESRRRTLARQLV